MPSFFCLDVWHKFLQCNVGWSKRALHNKPSVTYDLHVVRGAITTHVRFLLFLGNGGPNSNRTLFLITFSSSIFCATLGIAKFMKTGPCRLVSDSGFGGGFFKFGFLLTMVNVCSILLSKGFLVLPFGHIIRDLPAIGAWIGINYIPHIIYVRKLNNLS